MAHHSAAISSPKRPLKVIAIGALFFICLLGLGYYGWLRTLHDATGKLLHHEALGQTVELVTGNDVLVAGNLYEPLWTLVAALWGIKALLAAAIFQSAAYFFENDQSSQACQLGGCLGAAIYGLQVDRKICILRSPRPTDC